jgi:hypothetical protein
MKKGSKPRARRATRATRSRKASTSKKPKRTAKAGKKKQSISAQRQRREKKGAGGAETGAAASSIPVSQISHKKAAINPAKRVEANDGLHFDNQAEWDAYLQSLKPIDAAERLKHEEAVKALEQRIDLAPLIRAAESGVWEACWKLWYIAKQASYALNSIAEKEPEMFYAFARGCSEWPGVISRNPYVSRDNQRFLEKLQQGEDVPFINIPTGKKGRTASPHVLANRFVFQLYKQIETARAGSDSKSVTQIYRLVFPPQVNLDWIQGALNLEPFSAKTWRSWAEIAWQIVLGETDGKPEQDRTLRALGESAGKKKPKYCKELHERTIKSNVRAKIKARLSQAFELKARGIAVLAKELVNSRGKRKL